MNSESVNLGVVRWGRLLSGPGDRVFVLTGAGISAESGLPTFRASDGLWAGHRVEDVCTPEALELNPALVWQFYSERREQGAKAEPNPAHIALAKLEAKLGDRFFLCTQNVDDLHERAGSKRLVHMHGELAKSRCEDECGRPPVEDRTVYKSLDEVGRCACGARLRPHIVFFGEIPLEMDRIQQEIARCDADGGSGDFGVSVSRGEFCALGTAGWRTDGIHRTGAALECARVYERGGGQGGGSVAGVV